MKLSIVTTLYCSADYVEEFYRRASIVAKEYVGDAYEIIMVNDGSPDNSLDIAVELAKEDNHLVVIELSRNFGHHKAMMTGVTHAKGEEIFLIDVDLEEEPEWLIPFAGCKKAQSVDVVYGVQTKRKGKFFERCTGYMFYKLFNMLSSVQHPESPTTARLMSKKYVEALSLHKEQAVAFFCLCIVVGFKQVGYEVQKKHSSPTTYSLFKKIKLALTSITSFSDIFLKFIFWLGLGVSFFSVFFIAYIFLNRLLNDVAVLGWASIMLSLWLLSGIILMSVGIIGLYISRIFNETKGRPYTIIRHIYGGKS